MTDSSAANPEETWMPARLIPTSGIKGADEQEKRATSALLSVMVGVPEFSRSLLKKVGAPAGKVSSYIEPSFEMDGGKKFRPDGAIVVRRGSTEWKALVEVKTSTRELAREQIENYLDVARNHDFEAVVTISNQLKTATEQHPVTVDRRRTKRVALHHWSWVEVLSEAVVQREHRGVSDPDQAWILDELIFYLGHPQSGAIEFQDMGPHWVAARQSARDGTLRANDDGVADIVTRWDQFIRHVCLLLSRELGVDVKHVLPRKEQSDAGFHTSVASKTLADEGVLRGTVRVKHAAGDITLAADLRSRMITASLDVQAPGEGKPLTRLRWLLKQLDEAPHHVRVDVAFPSARSTTSNLLSEAREDPKVLLHEDKDRPPKAFVVSMSTDMGVKRGGEGSFISVATELLQDFYRIVVQEIKPWAATAPRLKAEEEPAPELEPSAPEIEAGNEVAPMSPSNAQ